MAASVFLMLLGLAFLASLFCLKDPNILSRVVKRLNNCAVRLAGLVAAAAALPILIHYLQVLYPLDLLTLPLASILFYTGITMLVLPAESRGFLLSITKKDVNYVRILACAISLAGITLLAVGLQ